MTFEQLIDKKGFDKLDLQVRVSKTMETIQCWSTGRNFPRKSTLKLLSKVLRCSEDTILKAIENSAPINETSKGCLTCGKMFEKRRIDHKYCSLLCARAGSRAKRLLQTKRSGFDKDGYKKKINAGLVIKEKIKKFGVLEEEHTREEVAQAVKDFLKKKGKIKRVKREAVVYENTGIAKALDGFNFDYMEI